MAKSKNGGSRAYIRGRIGSDVYSVGKDGMGKKQQVVRSLAVQVTNPRSQSQMFGRMIMSTVMQAVSALSPIIDHSFDGVAKGQPSISEFIRRNYALVKADALAHPASGFTFGLNKYQEKGVKGGNYVISDGSVVKPNAVVATMGLFMINLTADTLTVGGLREAIGVSDDGYMTIVGINDDGTASYVRLQVDPSLADDTVISSANVGSLFVQEGNITLTPTLSSTSINLVDWTSTGNAVSSGLILSSYEEGTWKHSACTLQKIGDYEFSSNNALPTYPVGTEQFLNGGDI